MRASTQVTPAPRIRTLLLPAFLIPTFLVPALLSPGCSKDKPARPTFDCDRFQKRAETCESAVLALRRSRIEAQRVAGDLDAHAAREAYLVFQRKFQKKVRQRTYLKRCRRIRGLPGKAARRYVSGLRYCYSRPTCKGFAACLLKH